MTVNQRRVEAFHAVMLSGSITSAAEKLGISQPAVSRLISDFEHEIGMKLFSRAGGNLSPTEDARSLLDDVEFFFRGLDGVYQAAQDIKAMRKGVLRLGVMPNLALDVVPDIVSSFLGSNPKIKLTLDVLAAPNIVNGVAARHFDIGFAQIPESRPDIERLGSYRLQCVCVVPVNHDLARLPLITPKDLKDENIVALSRHTLVAHNIRQAFLSANVSPNITLESQPSFAACALVGKGVGVAIVDALTASHFGSEVLISVPFEPKTTFDFHLVRANYSSKSRVADEFFQHTISVLEKNTAIEVI